MRSFIIWLLNLKTDSIGPDTELTLRLNRMPEGWQVFLMTLGVIAFAIWIYRKDGRATASPLLRSFLGVLRATLIALLIIVLAEPILLATNVDIRRAAVLLLVDDSFSMDLTFADADEKLRQELQAAIGKSAVTLKTEDGKSEKVETNKLEPRHFKRLTRLNVVSSALHTPGAKSVNFLDSLKEKHDLKILGFSNLMRAYYAQQLLTIGKLDSEHAAERQRDLRIDEDRPLDLVNLAASNRWGGETRIGNCLAEARVIARGQPIAGVVLISDGRQNAGEDAVQAAQSYKTQHIPIYTVGIGDPSEPRDFEATFEGPEMILPDDQSEGTALIRYKGYTHVNTIRVEMKNGDKIIASEEVKLGKPGEKTPVPLRFKESKPGKYTYTICIPEQQGELRADNNVATYNFEVVDKKVKVLFVEGQDLPRWEYRYLKNALRRDHTTEADVLLATSEGSFIWDGTDGKPPLEQFPVNAREINSYDVIIFGDVSPLIFTAEQVNLLRDFVRDGGGFIMIAGERFAPIQYTQGAWAEMLPVAPQNVGYSTPDGGFQESFSVELTPEGRRLAWTRLDSDEAANRNIWENLPRMYWYFPVKRKKELAITVAAHPFDKDERGHKMPLIVTMPYGSGQTMYIGVDSLWRWRYGVGDRYHYRFYNQAIRHLSLAKRLGGQKRFYLGIDRNIVAISDKVLINAVIKDENYREITAEKAIVHGKTPKGEEFVVELTRKNRAGNYEGGYFPAMQGEYTLWLKDDAQPDARQSDVTFKVEKPQLEFEDPRLNKELLQNLAQAGGDGGAYFSIDRLQDIPARIQPKEERLPRETVIDLWDNWFFFALFTVLITVEWLLRKRAHMI
ncbi:MAG: hypothetical protein V1899_11550 [Planctomycetota bacterium]